MDTQSGHSWVCRQCQRRVPVREPICYCGFPRERAAAGDASHERRDAWRSRLGAALLVVVCVGLIGLGVRAWNSGSPARAADGGSLQPAAEYPPLPQEPAATPASEESVSPQEDALEPEPPAPERDEPPPPRGVSQPRVSQPRTRPEGVTAPAPPATPAEEPPPQPAEAVRAADPPRPEGTAVDNSALIEQQLRELAREADALEERFRSFAASCLTSSPKPATSAGGTGQAGRNWFNVWNQETERMARQASSGIPTGSGVPPVDCLKGWQDAVASANRIAKALSQIQDAARLSGVLPGRWRQLLETYRLEGWDSYADAD